jgi:hypothetical protein
MMVVPPWNLLARVGKEGGKSDIRKPCLSLSSSISSGVVARAFSLLISSAFSISANSIVVSLRASPLALMEVLSLVHLKTLSFSSHVWATPIPLLLSGQFHR